MIRYNKINPLQFLDAGFVSYLMSYLLILKRANNDEAGLLVWDFYTKESATAILVLKENTTKVRDSPFDKPVLILTTNPDQDQDQRPIKSTDYQIITYIERENEIHLF